LLQPRVKKELLPTVPQVAIALSAYSHIFSCQSYPSGVPAHFYFFHHKVLATYADVAAFRSSHSVIHPSKVAHAFLLCRSEDDDRVAPSSDFMLYSVNLYAPLSIVSCTRVRVATFTVTHERVAITHRGEYSTTDVSLTQLHGGDYYQNKLYFVAHREISSMSHLNSWFGSFRNISARNLTTWAMAQEFLTKLMLPSPWPTPAKVASSDVAPGLIALSTAAATELSLHKPGGRLHARMLSHSRSPYSFASRRPTSSRSTSSPTSSMTHDVFASVREADKHQLRVRMTETTLKLAATEKELARERERRIRAEAALTISEVDPGILSLP
jgi:hypothetical protein